MKAGGIDPDHIITMMYNDVPFSKQNPFPGKLYNHPGDDVPDVYEGVVVDYEKDMVSPANLIKVLTGDESAGGKVLKSTEEDNVFLFFSDHGGADILALPGGYLHSKDLLDAINTMHEKKMYKKFVLYIEACFSGSMAIDFPEDLGISIVTAANDQESSWGWYCGSEAVVKGKDIGSCLGDEFSVYWMEDADKGEQKTETLEEQWNRIHAGVTKSHASRYGDKSFSADLIGEYVGYPAKKTYEQVSEEAWDSRDNKFLYLRHKYLTTTGEEKKKYEALYNEELSLRQQYDRYFNSIAKEDRLYSTQTGPVKNFNCYKQGIEQMEKIFGRNDYQFKYYNVIANMCNENPLAFSKY